VSRVLLVTQSTRSIGEFRRPWVRALYRRYVVRFRRELRAAVWALARDAEVTVLTSRELADPEGLPGKAVLRYFDDESFHVTAETVADITDHLESAVWPERGRELSLEYHGVWLPDVLTIGRGVVLRLEIAESLAAIQLVCDDAKPQRVVLLTGASIPERLARCVAQRQGWPVETASPRFVWPRIYARVYAALSPREERLRLRAMLQHPRAEVTPARSSTAERVLFVTCRPRHHYVVDPLAGAVRAAGADAHVVASDSDSETGTRLSALREGGVASSRFLDHLRTRDAAALVRHYRPIFRDLWRRTERAPGFRTRLAWNGIDLADVARPFLRDTVTQSLLSALLAQAAAFRAIDTIQPTAVVITSNRRHAERTLALAARVRGIPSVFFPGTLLFSRDPSNRFDLGERILVIGEYLRERMLSAKLVEPQRISVVGDPRSDAARRIPPGQLRDQIVREFGLASGRPSLVVVSKVVSLHFSSAEKEAFYRTIAAALEHLPAVNLLVKIHPNEDEGLVRRQAREWGWPGSVFTKTFDVHQLFAAADAAIMVTSMAGIEAMALDCPVVAVQTAGKDFEGGGMPPYVSENVVEHVDMGDAYGLAKALRRLLEDTEARSALVERAGKFAARYVHPVDGSVGRRLLVEFDEIRSEAAARRAP
jgi:glycosyltransferase involved in cell wall biosynthesis